MAASVNHQWLLAARPSGAIKESDFKWNEAPIPEPGPGEVLIRTIYVSLDPTMRGWMQDRPSYLPPVAIGEPMRAGGVGEVIKSNLSAFPAGTVVSGMTNWQEYVVSDGTGVTAMRAVPKGMSLPLSMSLFGTTGMTAYFGLLDLGQPRRGQTVVVSGAAGATGSVAGQIAKIKGCRVVGLAGTDEKCAWVRDDLGFDACINYKTENIARRLHEVCPNGIDIYFDNVGGEILNTALAQINMKARVVLCGGISSYNATEPPPGPSNYLQLVGKRARMEGFIVIDYTDRFPAATVELQRWLAEGRLKSKEDIVEGLENAPRALRSLFEGANTGKLLVKVSEEP